MKLTVHTFLTLDGVMQGPGGPDEDVDGGFDRGGWLVPHADADMGEIVEGWFGANEATLLGRTTFEAMRGFWPQVVDPDNGVARALNTRPKYVVTSRALPDDWAHTSALSGDPVAAVGDLLARPGGELQLHGSCALARTLHAAGLVDEYRLLTFPVTVGTGKRLFTADAPPATWELIESRTTGAGAVYTRLRRTDGLRAGAFTVADGREAVLEDGE